MSYLDLDGSISQAFRAALRLGHQELADLVFKEDQDGIPSL